MESSNDRETAINESTAATTPVIVMLPPSSAGVGNQQLLPSLNQATSVLTSNYLVYPHAQQQPLTNSTTQPQYLFVYQAHPTTTTLHNGFATPGVLTPQVDPELLAAYQLLARRRSEEKNQKPPPVLTLSKEEKTPMAYAAQIFCIGVGAFIFGLATIFVGYLRMARNKDENTRNVFFSVDDVMIFLFGGVALICSLVATYLAILDWCNRRKKTGVAADGGESGVVDTIGVNKKDYVELQDRVTSSPLTSSHSAVDHALLNL